MRIEQKPTLLTLVAASMIAFGGPTAAQSSGDEAGPPVHPRGCVFYQEANFQGDRGQILEMEDRDVLGDRWDDRISSVRCASSCRLFAYERLDYRGERQLFTGSVPSIGEGWDDKISSMRVTCRRQAPSDS